jgi:sigma-B regulation protein RsbU (phosphoserine phosphatase)
MRFRTLLLLGSVPLVMGTLVLTATVAALMLRGAARSQVDEEVTRSRRVFDDLQSYRRSLFDAQARVVADEPRLKAVVASEQVSRETIVGVAQEMQRVVRSDLFILTDASGKVRVDLSAADAEGQAVGTLPGMAAAMKDGYGAGVWIRGQAAYQVHAHSVTFGPDLMGVVIIGHRLDDRVAETVFRQTGSAVIVELDGRLVASWPREEQPLLRQLLTRLPPRGGGVVELNDGPDRYVAAASAFPGYDGERRFRYAVVRSLARALAPSRRLSEVLVVILAAALVLGVTSASLIARRLSGPLEGLVGFTREIAGGKPGARARVEGAREIQALAGAMNRMAEELHSSRQEMSKKERLEKEMEIAAHIQVALLPARIEVPGLEVATHMTPATEVGGDYFDVIADQHGCWICIGDVAGHGLTAGLVTVMLQSAIASVIQANPRVTPTELIVAVNTIVYENVRRRLKQKEHVTLTVIRYDHGGNVTFAGAHEEILIARALGGPCVRLPTPGAWIAVDPSIRRHTVESSYQLHTGDTMVLYTDGVTEAMSPTHQQFGPDRLCAAIEAHRGDTAEQLREHLVTELRHWSPAPDDDTTLMVIRYRGVPRPTNGMA